MSHMFGDTRGRTARFGEIDWRKYPDAVIWINGYRKLADEISGIVTEEEYKRVVVGTIDALPDNCTAMDIYDALLVERRKLACPHTVRHTEITGRYWFAAGDVDDDVHEAVICDLCGEEVNPQPCQIVVDEEIPF